MLNNHVSAISFKSPVEVVFILSVTGQSETSWLTQGPQGGRSSNTNWSRNCESCRGKYQKHYIRKQHEVFFLLNKQKCFFFFIYLNTCLCFRCVSGHLLWNIQKFSQLFPPTPPLWKHCPLNHLEMWWESCREGRRTRKTSVMSASIWR